MDGSSSFAITKIACAPGASGGARQRSTSAADIAELAKVSVFSELSHKDLEIIAEHTQLRTVEAGYEVSSVPARQSAVYFVLHGVLQVCILSPGGRQVAIRDLYPHAHFGDAAILANISPRDVVIIARTDAVYVRIEEPAFRQMYAQLPHFAAAITAHLALTATAQIDRIFEFVTLDLRDRLQAEILRLSHRGQRVGKRVLIGPAPTHEDFAARVGGTREGVTRALQDLVKRGLISTRRREITIHDVERLRVQTSHFSGPRPTHEMQLEP